MIFQLSHGFSYGFPMVFLGNGHPTDEERGLGAAPHPDVEERREVRMDPPGRRPGHKIIRNGHIWCI